MLAPTADPYRRYARLRAEDPVHEDLRGVWLLTRYDDICAVLRDPRFGREGFLALTAPPDGAAQAPAAPLRFQDAPGHTRLRNLTGKAFTPGLVDSLRPRLQQIVDDLIDRARDEGRLDLIAGLGFPLSVQVILELLGVPIADHERFQQWSRDLIQGLDPAVAAAAASARAGAVQQAMAQYFADLIAERRKRPRTDLITRLIAAEHDGEGLRQSELLDLCGLLFVAGHATTVDLIGNGMLNLVLHRSELRLLRAEPGLLAQAVEELLRYESPVQRVGRMTNTAVELRGKLIPEGAVVSATLGAANRDPAQYDQADRLLITRNPNRHLAFGHGARMCLGASLARLEGQIAIGTLVKRLPNLALVNDTPEWRSSTETRGLRELRVSF